MTYVYMEIYTARHDTEQQKKEIDDFGWMILCQRLKLRVDNSSIEFQKQISKPNKVLTLKRPKFDIQRFLLK